MVLKIIGVILILGTGLAAYRSGNFDFLKDWKRDLKYAKYYMVAMGIGLHIYWLYLYVTNI